MIFGLVKLLLRVGLGLSLALGIYLGLIWYQVTRLDDAGLRAALSRPLMLVQVTPQGLGLAECNCNRTLRDDEIPLMVRDALVATEDRRFFDHGGVDPIALVRAAATGFAEGGSTLTQQLAKSALTGDYDLIQRKIHEAMFAWRIESLYSKDDILRLYLSRVRFGSIRGVPVFGLRDAAEVYFGVEPADLSLAQSALLVGMLKATTTYQPIEHPQAAAGRALTVVNLMRRAGHIPASLRVDIAAALPDGPRKRPARDRFIEDHLLAEFRELGFDSKPGWYRIVTSLDPIAQYQARLVVEGEMSERRASGARRAALVTLDREGRIVALYGGRDYGRSTFNIATQGERQAASTAKLATYLAALEARWQVDYAVQDSRDALTGPFEPRNADDRYLGSIRMDQCLAQSRNVCTMFLAQDVGMRRISEMAARLGMVAKGTPGSSVVLGAAETTLLRNTAAYSSLTAGGRVPHPRAIRAVLGAFGRVHFGAPPERSRAVASPTSIDAMRRMLRMAVTEGTGRNADFVGGRAFGKTGTSQENRDAWFIGFTADDLTTGVWIGPAEGKTMRGISGGDLPARIFSRYNRNLVERFRDYSEGAPSLSR
ncbi:hypothetical protein BV394_01835 [Brevirhabdus pacifica]|uniref:peptidoglycan glycosyltransferase n=2 Tax=Brevirhabdus pacifica TaxID=1267768 RepID=A0A1U7DF74_9RHOB|nr:transglycosylase domain-containing protein [Brevirhabdus pacifica]APX88622.1 hypothetical protein BV394_01835 [Brevirhabdus pacifica]OWU79902.1 hypothetical protein ATO5_02530 [Loktanella sp. 22II-4b]PJJ86882.1 penicillin-binding protein 1A [Brevirhabdus pacifica]